MPDARKDLFLGSPIEPETKTEPETTETPTEPEDSSPVSFADEDASAYYEKICAEYSYEVVEKVYETMLPPRGFVIDRKFLEEIEERIIAEKPKERETSTPTAEPETEETSTSALVCPTCGKEKALLLAPSGDRSLECEDCRERARRIETTEETEKPEEPRFEVVSLDAKRVVEGGHRWTLVILGLDSEIDALSEELRALRKKREEAVQELLSIHRPPPAGTLFEKPEKAEISRESARDETATETSSQEENDEGSETSAPESGESGLLGLLAARLRSTEFAWTQGKVVERAIGLLYQYEKPFFDGLIDTVEYQSGEKISAKVVGKIEKKLSSSK